MDKSFEKKGLTKKSENISDWYHDVVLRAELAEYSEVKGCMILRPNGYGLWEKAQSVLDSWFKEGGVQNVYFPLFVPMSLFEKEKEHVEGFAPELAVVTHGGGEELAEPLAIRPTSETVITQKFAEWISSYRDLPMKLNQWCNVVRWEKRTYPFMRTSEFLWQEGHTAHADTEDSMKMVREALEWYRKFYEEYFAISAYVGLKSENEKFAGADATYSIELVMPDGKALQAATSHYLGTNFGKAFNVTYLDDKGEKQLVHQTSWGFSTRSIGGLVLTHGDDSGLVLPPQVALTQVVVIVLGTKDEFEQIKLNGYAEDIVAKLKSKGIRVKLDTDTQRSLGNRINNWELKGVPLRIEVGAQEVEKQQVKTARRDNFEKAFISISDIENSVAETLDTIQTSMLAKSKAEKERLTTTANSFDEFKKIMADNKMFIRAFWCEDPACELKIKEQTKAVSRVLELDQIEQTAEGSCVHCGNSAKRKWLFAQSY